MVSSPWGVPCRLHHETVCPWRPEDVWSLQRKLWYGNHSVVGEGVVPGTRRSYNLVDVEGRVSTVLWYMGP